MAQMMVQFLGQPQLRGLRIWSLGAFQIGDCQHYLKMIQLAMAPSIQTSRERVKVAALAMAALAAN